MDTFSNILTKIGEWMAKKSKTLYRNLICYIYFGFAPNMSGYPLVSKLTKDHQFI